MILHWSDDVRVRAPVPFRDVARHFLHIALTTNAAGQCEVADLDVESALQSNRCSGRHEMRGAELLLSQISKLQEKWQAPWPSGQISCWVQGVSYLRHGIRSGWVVRVEKSDKVQVALKRPSAGISGGSRWIPLAVVDSPKIAINNPAHAKLPRRDRSPSVEIAWGERSGSGKRGSSAKSGEQE